jgi:small subunit ribosomal protein S3
MGQKVNPIGFRLGINKNWDSRWFKSGNYSDWIIEDYKIRLFIFKTQKLAGITKIIIERAGEKCKVGIYSSKPGIIIGKKGIGIDQLKSKLKNICDSEVFINIYEIKTPESNAQLIASNIVQQIEKRVSFRRSIKRAMASAQKIGVEGIKIACSGRLGGAEMSRRSQGRVNYINKKTSQICITLKII